MGGTVVSRSGRVFAGMVYPDTAPIVIPVGDAGIRRVHMFDIPSALREHACVFLDGETADGAWWTVGEFRYAGEDYITAFARRVLRDGRVTMEYGVESDEPGEVVMVSASGREYPCPADVADDMIAEYRADRNRYTVEHVWKSAVYMAVVRLRETRSRVLDDRVVSFLVSLV